MQIQKQKLGFVILMWNSERVVEACLRSVFQLRSFKIGVIVVDNGSTDRSVEIAEKLRRELADERDAFLELITLDRNYGTTMPRNRGLHALEAFSPDYYCFLDSDTVVNDEAFLTLVGELERHPA